jgi:hypothetical protein
LTVEDDHGHRESIRPTAFHKFYREPVGEWVSLEELRPRDRLGGAAGVLRVVGVTDERSVERVYNMTVEGEHVYYVSALGVLAHNADCKIIKGKTASAAQNRVRPRRATIEAVDAAQPRNAAGEMVDPHTLEPLTPGEIDLGHKPGNEWRVRKKIHEESGANRKDVIEAENDPDLYWWEDLHENRNHRHEQDR